MNCLGIREVKLLSQTKMATDLYLIVYASWEDLVTCVIEWNCSYLEQEMIKVLFDTALINPLTRRGDE